jgi:hypothetical protein
MSILVIKHAQFVLYKISYVSALADFKYSISLKVGDGKERQYGTSTYSFGYVAKARKYKELKA